MELEEHMVQYDLEHSLPSGTLSITQAAQRLGIGKQLAYNLASEGKLPGALRLGRRIVVSRQVLEAFIAGKNTD